jgi:hypothetical protein
MNFEDKFKLVTIIISLSALGISFWGWKNSRTSIRQTIKNSYMSALFEIDKQLMNNPDLWTIYDSYPVGLQKSNDGKPLGQRRAFISYHFNLFEVTHTNYTRILYKNKADKEFWDSMQKYIQQFFKCSTEARNIFKETSIQELYLPDFLTLINKMITDIETHEISAQQKAMAVMPSSQSSIITKAPQ